MKSNKLRLAALAMTLAMVTTSVPSAVLAADFTSDFGSEEVTFTTVDDFTGGDADITEELPVENDLPVAGSSEEAEDVVVTDDIFSGTVSEEIDTTYFINVTFNYDEGDPNKPDGSINYFEAYKNEDGSYTNLDGTWPQVLKGTDGKPVIGTYTKVADATCTEAEKFTYQYKHDKFTTPNGIEVSEEFQSVDPAKGPLGHDWAKVATPRKTDPSTCLEKGTVTYDYKCANGNHWLSDADDGAYYDKYQEAIQKDFGVGVEGGATYSEELGLAAHQLDPNYPTWTGYVGPNNDNDPTITGWRGVNWVNWSDNDKIPANPLMYNVENGEANTEDLGQFWVPQGGSIEITDYDDYYYQKVTWGWCSVCGCAYIVSKEDAVDHRAGRLVVRDKKDIDSNINGLTWTVADGIFVDNDGDDKDDFNDDNIVLTDCKTAGEYKVYYERGGSDPVYYDTIKVPAHHVVASTEIQSTDKKYSNVAGDDPFSIPGLEVIRDKDNPAKVVLVRSTSCKNAKKYIQIDTCVKGHEISKETKTSVLSENHSINGEQDAAITAIKNSTTYSRLLGIIDANNDGKVEPAKDHYNVVPVTATCTSAGKINLEYMCLVCGKVAKTVEINLTTPLGHLNATPVKENVVEATCTEEGSYDSVVYCERCGAEVSRQAAKVSALGHKFDNNDEKNQLVLEGLVVVDGGNWPDRKTNTWGRLYQMTMPYETHEDVVGLFGTGELGVRAVLYKPCKVCGEFVRCDDGNMQPFVNDYVEYYGAYPEITVNSVKKEGSFCEQGEISLTATYKKTSGDKETLTVSGTYPYYSSQVAYNGRTAHHPGEVVEENRVEPTETTEGSVDRVVYCSICGKEMYRGTVTIPAKGHTHTMTKVDAKEATCTEEGNIEYYTCSDEGCKDMYFKDEKGEEPILAEEIVVPALGHDIQKVEKVDATTTAEGCEEHYECTRCGKCYEDAEGTKEIDHPVIPKIEMPVKVEGVKTNMYPSDVYPSKGYAKISWKAVDEADNYRVSVRELGSKTWTKIETNSANTSYTIKEPLITVGKSYEVRVAAGKNGVFGPRSDVIRRYYRSVKPTFTKTDSTITVSWDPVERGSSYMVLYSENKSMKPYKTIIVRNGITTAVLKNLKAGTRYYIRVRPYDKTGKTATGALSPLKSVVTKKK